MMASGVRLLSGAHTQEHRRTGRILGPLLASSPELNERAVYKRFAITSELEDALIDRHVDEVQAGVLADLGVRAYYRGYGRWVTVDDSASLADRVAEQLDVLRQALVGLPDFH